MTRPRSALLLGLTLALALVLPLAPVTAQTADGSVVISQVYGGGGNSGAPYNRDFVELHNAGDAPVALTGLSLQYASATGTGSLGANAGQLVALEGTVPAGGYLLVGLGGGSNGADLPAVDVSGTINMSASAGKVALVEGTEGLGCNGGSAPCDAAQVARILDLVGFGGANYFEGSGPAPGLSNTTAALRNEDGAQDTDDNAADFAVGAPAPRSSGSDEPDDGADVVISQVYGGGGNSGATYTHDFVELRNRTATAVDLTGWSVQYASAAGTSWQTTPLQGSIPAGGHYLVQQAAGNGGTTPLPAPDATGTIAMSSTNGKVALVEGTTALSGGCPTAGQLADLVGFGSASCFEGSAATSTLSNSTAALRLQGGAQDTDDNAADFTVEAPAPRNSGAEPPEEPEPEPDVDRCEVAGDELTPISAIQGAGTSTPIAGTEVVTRGVVTADFTSGGDSGLPANQGLQGFFVEAVVADRDADPATSEGLFVYEPAGTFEGKIGDLVAVAGRAGEYSGATQVTATDVDVCADAAVDTTLPAPAALPLPVAPADRGEVYEPIESMRVTHPELTVVEFYELERYGTVRLSSGGVLPNPTNLVDPRDDAAYEAVVAANAAHNLILDDGRTGQNLDPLPYVVPGDTLRIGDQLRDATAVLHHAFDAWRLQPVDIGELTEELRSNRTRPRPQTPPEVGGTVRVGSFNVLNYFDGDGQGGGFPTARGAVTPSELERQTEKIVDAILRLDAHVLGLIEIENDGGEHQATRTLVEAINAEAGEERYAFIDTGVIGTDAIKLAFIYQPAVVRPAGEHAILDSSVDPRFVDTRSRPALAQTFTEIATNRSFTVVNNHLKSKGSGCGAGDDDPRQGNCNGTRTAAAEALADWAAGNPTGQPSAGTLILGDLNAYAQEDPIRVLQAAGYTDLLDAFAPDGVMPYTYTFDATQGYLDHALASARLLPYVTGAAAWNINADEVPAIDYQESVGAPGNSRFRTPDVAARFYDPSAFRSSDHDPVLVGLAIPGCPGNSQGHGNAKGGEGCPGGSAGRGNAAPGHPRP